MRKLRSNGGFTLIELVIIILVLGLLAATALPRFLDLRSQAQQAAEKGVVGGVRGGIAIAYASNVLNTTTSTWPDQLDSYGTGTNTTGTRYFSGVIDPGLDDGNWQKTGTSPDTYLGPAGNTYIYYASSGEFI